MAGILDQHQDNEGANFGFGQASGVKYRGQCFTPALAGSLVTIGWSRNLGSTDIKCYLDSSSSGTAPDHAVGSELYSFIIPNASLVNGFGTYNLPTPLPLTVGQQYCFYLATFIGGVYTDDYQDCHGINTPGGVGGGQITNNGSWFAENNIEFHFATYMQASSPSFLARYSLRPRIFAP